MSRNRPHHRAPHQLVLVALVHVIRGLSAAAAIGFLVATVALKDPQLLIGTAIAFAVLTISAAIHLAEANKCRCPVCTTTLFGRTGCSKHKTARRIFGSYRLHTAAEILIRPLFHCHHCGEGVLSRTQPAGEAPDSPGKPRRRISKSLSRVPIARLPERNIQLPAAGHARLGAPSQETSLPS